MNLLFYLARYPGWGGIETVTHLIVPELLKLGYQVDIVSHRQEYEAQPMIPGVTLYTMPRDSFYCVENVEYAKQIVTRHHYDVIVYQDCYEPNERIAVEISQLYHIPLIVFEHNTPLYARKNVPPVPWLSIKGILQRIYYVYLVNRNIIRDKKRKKYLYDHCFKYVMLSKQYIPEIMSMLGIPNENSKFTYINNPIVPSQECVPFNSKQNEILYVGRLVNIKNVIKILAIWRKVSAELSEYKLTIVGDGPEKKKLERFVSDYHLPRVTFVGFQSPEMYYRRAKFMLMTSKFEGWSMTLLEAMSVGCIPFAENTFSALCDIIDDNQNGFILPAGCSLRIWHQRLISEIHSADKLSLMSKNAEAKTRMFTTPKIAEDWHRLLETLKDIK